MRIVTDFSVTSAPSRARHGWHPGWLFRGAASGVWFDPSDLSTLFQDVAGTVPVEADGDPVALMLDKSGNGNHAAQPVVAARPTWRSDGTLSWLEFDGVDDRLVVPGITFTKPDLTICAGLAHAPGGLAWGSVRSRTTNGYYVGLSNPVYTGPISNSGGQTFVNRIPAPNDRIQLRNALLSPVVVTVANAQSSQFTTQEWQMVSYWNTAPPAAKLFGYVEAEGEVAASVLLMEKWVAEKTGVLL